MYVDMARVFSNSFTTWGANPTGLIRRYFQGNGGDWMSSVSTVAESMNTTLRSIDDKIN